MPKHNNKLRVIPEVFVYFTLGTLRTQAQVNKFGFIQCLVVLEAQAALIYNTVVDNALSHVTSEIYLTLLL